MVDDTIFKFEVIPTEGSLFEMAKYIDPITGNISKDFHNFTWEPVSFTRGNELLVQLNFKYPLNVSTSSQERDQIEL